MRDFVYNGLPTQVIFGRGTRARLGEAIAQVGGTRALLLSTPQQAAMAREACLGAAAIVSHFDGAVMHTPVDVSDQAMDMARSVEADCIVALGGGSTTGLGKALALRSDLPQVVLPTTYAGSEMTPILGQTEHGRKTTIRSAKVLPELVIYDVELTLGLPAGISGTSGINAMAHAVEGLYARDTNPIMQMMAKAGIAALARALPAITKAPGDIEARSDALYGAWLCGMVLGAVGMALHHKLCHTIGGSFDLPHAETHTILLPHAIAYNAAAAPEAMVMLREALGGVANPARAFYDLGRAVHAPAALRDLGMAETGIDQAADEAVQNPYWNPRSIEREAVRELIARAWAGDMPA